MFKKYDDVIHALGDFQIYINDFHESNQKKLLI